MKFLGPLVALSVLLGGVGLALADRTEPPPVVLTFVGDIMLGRSVGTVAAADPDGVFRHIRHVLRDADLVLGNLESPLTHLPHVSPNPNVLIAEPTTAGLLAAAGFDVLSLANNHIGDAGPAGVVDTMDALTAHGLLTVGAGTTRREAETPTFVTVRGIRVAMLAFDATGAGLAADETAGVVPWDPERARTAMDQAAAADLVLVSVHGGVEYLPEADPRMLRIADMLVSWGADVVWGHGPHVTQPVFPAANGTSVVATSLGNFLFDQRGAATGKGVVLQVLADRGGVIAHRTGGTSHHDLRVHFTGWQAPDGDAVFLDGSWWQLHRSPGTVSRHGAAHPDPFPYGEVMAAALGPLTGPDTELVVSYRARSGSHPVRDGLGITWTDGDGFTMHLGVFRPDDLAPIWQAGVVPAPIAAIAVCDGSLALGYRTLDSPEVRSMGAAVWRPAGLIASDMLVGPGSPACADVDGDGRADPLVLDRPGESDIRP